MISKNDLSSSQGRTLARTQRLSQIVARRILGFFGWRVQVEVPNAPKYVVIGAFHTSNWDFPWGVLALIAIGFKYRWIGKDTLFFWPLGILMRRLGGIPVNRRLRNNFITQIVDFFNQHEELAIIIAPEGTRRKTDCWKSGFYHIALGAHVPIVMGYIDYRTKTLGFGPMFTPSGNIEADMTVMREFYADKIGKYPQDHSEICIRKREDDI